MKEISLYSKDLVPNTNKTYIGIDFGTSTTVVSIAYFDSNKKQIVTVPIELNQKFSDGAISKASKIPTMIAFYNNNILFGEGAEQVRLKTVKNTDVWYEFKMDLGIKNDFLYPHSKLVGKFSILNAKDATTLFFKYLKAQIDKYLLDQHLSPDAEYSISIPASFEPDQRQDMMDALKVNGLSFKEQAFIDEPNAAFLSYVSNLELQKEINLIPEINRNILVFDYGAGTCDISILSIGLDNGNFTSKNLAVSKFDYIGGKEIDNLIACDILLPQLFANNNLDQNYFSENVLKSYIIPSLAKYAELLKINACKSIELNLDKVDRENIFYLPSPINITLGIEQFSINKAQMSYKEFDRICNVFTKHNNIVEKRINQSKVFKSIFDPINTALTKASLKPEFIDYVLFIGGSSRNPLIQQAVKEFFPKSKYLIPNDLQTHVSSGAAINSLLYNGFNKNIIRPITNENIYLMMNVDNKDTLQLLVGSGIEIPTKEFMFSNLKPQKKSSHIELPIFLGGKHNLIKNIVVEQNVTAKSDIVLFIRIDANRTIQCRAVVDGKPTVVEIENPLLSNFYNNSNDKAERDYAKRVKENNGEITYEMLYDLFKSYERRNEYAKAAEIAEEIQKKFNKFSFNNLGILFAHAKNPDKAEHYYHEAGKNSDGYGYINLASRVHYTDPDLCYEYLKKAVQCNPSDELLQYRLLDFCYEKGINKEESYKKLESIYSLWKSEYTMTNKFHHKRDLKDLARIMNDAEMYKKLEKAISEEKDNDGQQSAYKSENLVTSSFQSKYIN